LKEVATAEKGPWSRQLEGVKKFNWRIEDAII
jgi:hypothetical protein